MTSYHDGRQGALRLIGERHMKWLTSSAVIALLALSIGCSASLPGDPETEANKAVVRDYLERIVNQGDMEAWPELIAGETLLFNGQAMSRSDLESMRETFHMILHDMRVEVEEQIAEGDTVASRVTISGTHLGDYMGLKASGKELSFSGITYDRLRDGKVVEVWHEMNIWGTLLMASD
jgi:predicted ester cyclase